MGDCAETKLHKNVTHNNRSAKRFAERLLRVMCYVLRKKPKETHAMRLY